MGKVSHASAHDEHVHEEDHRMFPGVSFIDHHSIFVVIHTLTCLFACLSVCMVDDYRVKCTVKVDTNQ